jgi:hypothetical protein
MKKGSLPLESDMFVLEEIGLFDGLAKGRIISDKIDPNSNIVMAYPGELMQSLKAIQDLQIKIHRGRSIYARHQAVKATWLDTSNPIKALEKEFYSVEPHPEVVKRHQAGKRAAIHKRILRVAISSALVIAATVSALLFDKPKPDTVANGAAVVENDYQAAVSFPIGEDTMTVTYKKSAKNQPAHLWTAFQVQKGKNDPGRTLLFREDVAYIQDATSALRTLGIIKDNKTR